MLDDSNIIAQRDSHGALALTEASYRQCLYKPVLVDVEHDDRPITAVIIVGVGDSAIAADYTRTFLRDTANIPLEVSRDGHLPRYVNRSTLVIACSFFGDTDETIDVLEQSIHHDSSPQLAVVTTGGKIAELAARRNIMCCNPDPHHEYTPRLATIAMVRSILRVLQEFAIIDATLLGRIADASTWLRDEMALWTRMQPTSLNYAKQLALLAAGKTPVFYADSIAFPIAYKWKASWNEVAKNIAFSNQLPEAGYNELSGWSSHPIDKPYVIFDLVRDTEPEESIKQFAATDRVLSGKRPKANIISIQGDTLVKHFLWGNALADSTSTYLAILNGNNPSSNETLHKYQRHLHKR